MNLDELIEAERATPAEASRHERTAMWTSIERSALALPLAAPLAATKLSVMSKIGGVLSTTAGKVAVAAALLAGGTAGALSIPPPPTPPATQPSDDAKPKPKPKPGVQRPKGHSGKNTTPDAAPVPVEQELAPLEDPPTVPVQRPKGTQAPAPTETSPPSEPPGTEAPPADPPPSPATQGDIALLARAEKALRAGKHDAALAYLRRHRKLYVKSPLVERREALFVIALCKGNRSLAPKARWKFNKRWPESSYRSRLRAECR